MKRLVTMLLAFCLLLSTCACSGTSGTDSQSSGSAQESSESAQNSSETSSPDTEEKVSLRIAIDQHDADLSDDSNFTEFKPMLQQAADELGYEIEWIPLRDSDTRSEQIAVMLAGDLPDIFWGLLTDDQVVNNASLFVPLEDKIQEYAPNVYELYESGVENWEEFLTYPDGHIYSMIGNIFSSPNNAVQGTMWINQKWLDDLGLSVPTTMDEFTEVLTAFRDNDCDGDGDASNEIPLDWCQAHYAAKYYELAHSYGLPIDTGKMYDIVDGEVLPAVNTDVFRNFLEEFHQLVADGLANPEGATQTNEQYNSNISSGKVGVFWGWAPYTYITDTELQSQYVPVSPISADGATFRVQPNLNNANRNGFVITTACENVEAAMKLWDYLEQDEETQFSAAFGPEGLIWEFVDGVPTNRVYTAEDATAMGFEDIASNAGTSAFAATVGLRNCGPLMLTARDNPPETTGGIRQGAVELYEPYYTEQTMSRAVVPADVMEEFTFTTDGLEDFINAFACESILNGVTDESWNTYVNSLPQYGYDYYVSYYQKYLDGSF